LRQLLELHNSLRKSFAARRIEPLFYSSRVEKSFARRVENEKKSCALLQNHRFYFREKEETHWISTLTQFIIEAETFRAQIAGGQTSEISADFI
jgi:hypothetical protein